MSEAMRVKVATTSVSRRYRGRRAAWMTFFRRRGWVCVTLFLFYWRVGVFTTHGGAKRYSIGPLEVEVLGGRPE